MYDTLTPIIGQPDFESLQKLKNEIKANAQSVPSTLGGGNHGLLGMVLTPAEYAVISAVPFVAPAHPGNLVFPPGTTGVQSKAMEIQYRNDMKTYEQCIGVEKAILQQINKAVHDDWLRPIRDNVTNAINRSIPDVLAFLFQEHGDVSAESLTRKEKLVREMVYTPATDPVDKVFTEVSDLADFAAAAGAPYSRQQKINIAYVILMRARVFSQNITEWNRLIRVTPTDNTWENFKRYFRQAYCELKEVDEIRMAETPFNQANLVCQIVDAVQESLSNNEDLRNDEPPAPAANAARPPTTQSPAPSSDPAMTALLQQMMLMNTNMLNAISGNGGGNRSNNNNNGGGRNNCNRNRNRRNNNNRRQMRYCWTCGWCTHDGEHCRNPADGHKAEATVSNRMGGSTDGLPPGFE